MTDKSKPAQPASVLPDSSYAGKLFPHEIAAALYVLAGFVMLERLPVTYPRSAIVLGSLLPSSAVFVIGAAVILLRRRLRKPAMKSGPSVRDELILLARALIVLIPTLSIHFLLKSFIHLMNGKNWDHQLYALDQTIHFGFSPSRFFTALFANPFLLAVVDIVYSNLYFVVVVTYTAILLTLPPVSRRLAFASSYTTIWIVGSILYLTIPSWGPVFVFSSDFQQTLSYMPLTMKVQRTLFQELYSLIAHPLAPRVIKFGSVAAFPSMHLAVTSLFTLASYRISRRWFLLNLFMVTLMVIGSIVSGYHYLIDDYAGCLIAAGVWFLSLRLFERRGTELSAGNPAAMDH
ncbi:MAG: phosphatase PAP2 family protein [Acidobacteriota bacterium]